MWMWMVMSWGSSQTSSMCVGDDVMALRRCDAHICNTHARVQTRVLFNSCNNHHRCSEIHGTTSDDQLPPTRTATVGTKEVGDEGKAEVRLQLARYHGYRVIGRSDCVHGSHLIMVDMHSRLPRARAVGLTRGCSHRYRTAAVGWGQRRPRGPACRLTVVHAYLPTDNLASSDKRCVCNCNVHYWRWACGPSDGRVIRAPGAVVWMGSDDLTFPLVYCVLCM